MCETERLVDIQTRSLLEVHSLCIVNEQAN